MSNEGSNRDHANQIKQASDQSRGAAGSRVLKYLTIIDAIRWFERRGKWVPATRNLDPPTPPNEGDALRGERNG